MQTIRRTMGNQNFFIALLVFLSSILIGIGLQKQQGAYFIASMAVNIGIGAFLIQRVVPMLVKRKNLKSIVVVGIGGEKLSGKSTAAGFLEKECGYYHTYFAKTLKAACGRVFNLTEGQMHDQKLKELPFQHPVKITSRDIDEVVKYVRPFYPGVISDSAINEMKRVARDLPVQESARKILQTVGTEILRDCVHNDFHALCVKQEIQDKLRQGWSRFVISDARFGNERGFIRREFSGFNVLIKNPIKKDETKKKDLHPSENSLGDEKDYDFVVTNEKKDVEDLFDSMREVLADLHSQRATPNGLSQEYV